jgi:arginyl-tRNA--protein-N-Asp/Glu arginylyltransferase
MKVFIVFFETGSYDDHSRNIQDIFATRPLAELYIEKQKEKNVYLSSLTDKYIVAIDKWKENCFRYAKPPEPQLYDLIRSMRGELCDDCKHRPTNDLCQSCLSREDKKIAVNKHSMNKSVWRQQCQQISKEHSLAQEAFTRLFLKPYEEKLEELGITDLSNDLSNWYPSSYLYGEDDKFEIEEREVKDV